MTDFGQGIFAQGFVRPSVPGREAARQRRRQAAGGAAGASARRAGGRGEEGRDRQGLGGGDRGQVVARAIDAGIRRHAFATAARRARRGAARAVLRAAARRGRGRRARARAAGRSRACSRCRPSGRRSPAALLLTLVAATVSTLVGVAVALHLSRLPERRAHAAVVRHRAAAHLLRPDRRVRLHPRLRPRRVRHAAARRSPGVDAGGPRQGAVHAGRASRSRRRTT